jgi:hypothetical protein
MDSYDVHLHPIQFQLYNTIQHYVIKFVSDMRHAGWWFSLGTPVSSTNKTDRYDITEILLKVALNITSQYAGFELTTLVVLSTDCTDSCKSN